MGSSVGPGPEFRAKRLGRTGLQSSSATEGGQIPGRGLHAPSAIAHIQLTEAAGTGWHASCVPIGAATPAHTSARP